MSGRFTKAITATAIIAVMVVGVSGCGVDYVSDEAKEASERAERFAQAQEHLPDRVQWHPKSQVKDGDLLKETGTVKYNCHDYTYVTYITDDDGHTTPDSYSATSCGSKKNYRLVYEKDGSIRAVTITDKPVE